MGGGGACLAFSFTAAHFGFAFSFTAAHFGFGKIYMLLTDANKLFISSARRAVRPVRPSQRGTCARTGGLGLRGGGGGDGDGRRGSVLGVVGCGVEAAAARKRVAEAGGGRQSVGAAVAATAR